MELGPLVEHMVVEADELVQGSAPPVSGDATGEDRAAEPPTAGVTLGHRRISLPRVQAGEEDRGPTGRVDGETPLPSPRSTS